MDGKNLCPNRINYWLEITKCNYWNNITLHCIKLNIFEGKKKSRKSDRVITGKSFSRYFGSNKPSNKLFIPINRLNHVTSPSFLLSDRLYRNLCLLLSNSQSLNFAIRASASLLPSLMSMIPDHKFFLWTFYFGNLWYITSSNQQLLGTASCSYLPNFIFQAMLNVRFLAHNVLLVFLHHKQIFLSLFDLNDLLPLHFNLFLKFSVSLVPLNQFFDFTFNFRQVLWIVDSASITSKWILTGQTIGYIFMVFVFWRTNRTNWLVWNDLLLGICMVFLLEFVFWRKILLVLMGKFLGMTGWHKVSLVSRVLIFLASI